MATVNHKIKVQVTFNYVAPEGDKPAVIMANLAYESPYLPGVTTEHDGVIYTLDFEGDDAHVSQQCKYAMNFLRTDSMVEGAVWPMLNKFLDQDWYEAHPNINPDILALKKLAGEIHYDFVISIDRQEPLA